MGWKDRAEKVDAPKEEKKSSWKDRAEKVERPWYSLSGEGLLRGSLQSLPIIGSIAGGVAGSVVPGAGTLAGGAAGGIGGKSLQNTLETALLGEGPESSEEMYRGLNDAAISGAASELGGQMLIKAGGSLAKSGVQDIAKSFNRPGADQVRAAAGRLGVKPTQGMLTDDYMVRNLENSISQSPSVPGAIIRSEQRPIQEAIKETSERSVADATGQSPYEAGGRIKQGVSSYFENKVAPLRESYDEIATHTKNIPINKKGLARIANNIRKLDSAKFEGFEGNSLANKFAKALENVETVNDIKLLSTKAKEILRDKTASNEAKSVAAEIVKKLEQAQGNTITRQAVDIARQAPVTSTSKGKFLNKSQKGMADAEAVAEGEDIGRRLVGDIKKTNKSYRGVMDELREFGEGSGLTKGQSGLSGALEDIGSVPNEQLPQAIFDSNNLKFMRTVQEKMPQEFEVARQIRLSEIARKAQRPNGEIDPRKLQKIVAEMRAKTPEAAEMLFGKKNLDSLGDVDALLKVTPEKVGASDTPRGLSFQPQNLFNPVLQAGDAARYGLLKGKKLTPKAGNLLKKSATPARGLINWGLLDERD